MATSEKVLIVVEAFGKYSKGDIVRGDLVIQAIQQGANRGRVVLVTLPDAAGGESH